METLVRLLADFVKTPIANWYKALSERARFFINEFVVIVCCIGVFCGLTMFIISDRLDEFDDRKSEIHENGTIQRIDVQKSVYNNLQLLMSETECKRACIIELHNGVNNPSGLPYLYGEMTYEQTADGEPFIADSYQRITVSTYKMGIYMHQHFEFFGTTESLKNIDKKFYNQVKANGTKYIGVVSLHNKNKVEIGFLLVTFDNETMTNAHQKDIIFEMSKYAQYIVQDLTMCHK